MKMKVKNLIPLVVMLSMITWGCAQSQKTADTSSKPPTAEQKQQKNVMKGKIAGKSKKAKTISIEVGKGDQAKVEMVRYDEETKGLEYAKKGEAAIVEWEFCCDAKLAKIIKPKLAKLPEGTSEIKTPELKGLVESKADFMIIDSRPGKRYAQSHIPGAVSIPVDEMKTKMDMLPKEKDKLLVFYCGGVT